MIKDMTPKAVRLTVSDILDKRKMSTRTFAKKANLTYTQALSIRRGVYTRLDFDTMGRICEALDVTPGELLELVDIETN